MKRKQQTERFRTSFRFLNFGIENIQETSLFQPALSIGCCGVLSLTLLRLQACQLSGPRSNNDFDDNQPSDDQQ